MKFNLIIVLLSTLLFGMNQESFGQVDPGEKKSDDQLWVDYQPANEGNGKHIVLISGDEEYRSEEALPMLGQILSQHHGFRCSVLFAIDPDSGEIDPNNQKNIPGIHLVENADLVIMALRFRNLPNSDMEIIDEYLKAGKPIIGLRTSTHAFRLDKESEFHHYTFNHNDWKGGFGQQVLGDTWISHHGKHKIESTRGVVNADHKGHVVLKGIDDVWGNTDVYGIRNLSDDAVVLLRGQVLQGMSPDDSPVEGKKNDPMMPLAWFKSYQLDDGQEGKAFCTTMGSSTDFASEDLRRLIVNATFHLLDMESEIDGKANVEFVSRYEPTMYGFNSFTKGMKPSDFELSK